jgi:hypothetical protein
LVKSTWLLANAARGRARASSAIKTIRFMIILLNLFLTLFAGFQSLKALSAP